LREFLVFCPEWQLGPEDEVLEGVLVEDAMDSHMIFYHFEVKAPVEGTEPVERLAIPLDPAETIILQMSQVVLAHRELVEEFTLDLASEATFETQHADINQLDAPLRDHFGADGVDVVLVLEDAGNHAIALERVGSVVELFITDPEAVDPGFPGGAGLSTFVGGQVSALTMNVPRAEELVADPSVQRCVDEWVALEKGAAIDSDTRLDAMHACQVFRMAMKLLEGAGDELTPATFIAAVGSIGSFSLPGLAEASLGPGKHGAGDLLRRFAYDPDLGHMVAIGEPISAAGLR